MEQEPILNEHNKQEYLPMHTGGMNIHLIIKMHVLLFGLLVLCGCGHRETTDIAFSDSIVCGIVEAEQQSDSISNEIPLPPEPEWKSDSKNKYRELTDSEIADLSFDGYDSKWSLVHLERWKEFVEDNRPYSSKLGCSQCGQQLLVIYSESPQEYWEGLCGRGGYFFICTHCKRIDDFECTVMN